MVRPRAGLIISSQNLRASWKPVNPQDCVWENSVPNHHEDHIAGKGDNSPQPYNFGSQIHSYASCHEKFPQQRQQWTRNGEKWRTFRRLTKVRSKKVVIDEAKTKGAKVYFASFMMDLCHLKNSELEPQYQKHKGRVVFWGDIVNDDSGSNAVLTEQGSSASQMTAAKVMDIIPRLPGCAGQAADAVSAETLVKMEDAPQSLKIPNRNVQTFGFVYHDTNGLNHGPVWKIQSFILSEICTVILWPDCYGKDNFRKNLLT